MEILINNTFAKEESSQREHVSSERKYREKEEIWCIFLGFFFMEAESMEEEGSQGTDLRGVLQKE